jgi:CRISPR/Cas system-associated exonuclease Cas4 (RecB family)
MKKFLEQVGQYALQRYGNTIGDLTIVLPNRRAALFLQKYISENITKPIFSPKLLTISELISSFTELGPADHNRLMIHLYNIYNSVTGSKEPFDDFYYWGEMLLADFNEVDQYLVDAEVLYKNIQSLKEIDWGFDFLNPEQLSYLSAFWNHILNSKDSESRTSFLNLWAKLPLIHRQFNEALRVKKIGYEGMRYRDMVHHLSDFHEQWSGRPLFFVGFNALNHCEIKLLKFMKLHAETSFFWDYADHYLNNLNHEAGKFIRENTAAFPMPSDFQFDSGELCRLEKLEVVSVSSNTGQSVYCSHWLLENQSLLNDRFDNTALVLCDEKLVEPVIQALPASIDMVNVTMGYPFRNSVVYGLLKALADLDKNSRTDGNSENIFYYRHVLTLLSHPLINQVVDHDMEAFFKRISETNKIYLRSSDFVNFPFLDHVFKLPDDAACCKHYLQVIISALFEYLPEVSIVEKELLHQLYLAINQLHASLFDEQEIRGEVVSKRLFYQLLTKYLDGLSVPFEGEPLKGLQIIGFLETRCLDFDNLIFISASDNQLPGGTHRYSFIPYALRKGFGLPLHEHRQAMHAYYFYRLLHRAKKVVMVYDNRSDGMSKGEPSRYIAQIKNEMPWTDVSVRHAVFGFEPESPKPVKVDKSKEVFDRLIRYTEQTNFSPTALNTYLDCRLKFFFSYIEKIKEPDEISEHIDNLIFGRVAHTALEHIYQPFIGKIVDKDTLIKLIKNKDLIQKALTSALQREYFKDNPVQLSGNNLLANKIIEKYLYRILQHDLESAPFTILGIEKRYIADFPVEVSGKRVNLRVGGTIDRIDQTDEGIRIIDYKTGKSKNSLVKIQSMFAGNDRNKAVFQTMLYAHSFSKIENPNVPVLPAVYGARAVFQDDFSPLITFDNQPLSYQLIEQEYVQGLTDLLREIVDENVPFDQTPNRNNCTNCLYNIICNRT